VWGWRRGAAAAASSAAAPYRTTWWTSPSVWSSGTPSPPSGSPPTTARRSPRSPPTTWDRTATTSARSPTWATRIERADVRPRRRAARGDPTRRATYREQEGESHDDGAPCDAQGRDGRALRRLPPGERPTRAGSGGRRGRGARAPAVGG